MKRVTRCCFSRPWPTPTGEFCRTCGRETDEVGVIRVQYDSPAGPPVPPEWFAQKMKEHMDREVEVHEFATIEIGQSGNRLLAGPFERIGRHLDRKTRPVRQCARGVWGAVKMAARTLVRRGL